MTDDHGVESGEADVPEALADSKRKPIPNRTKGLFGLLALLGVTFSVNSAHVFALENELRVIADAKAVELISGESRAETAALVTATKEYLIYGDVSGKVEVFIKVAGNGDRVTGVDFFFLRDNDGEWRLTDSAMCTDKECQIRGAKAFAAK